MGRGESPPPTEPFRRDDFTRFGYWATAYGVFAAAALGPAMPFLRDELNLTFTIAGLHFTALAVGTTLSGATMDRAMRRYGRRSLVWLGGAGTALGAAILAAAQHPAGSIAAAFLVGVAAAAMLASTQSALAVRHGSRRAIAFTEASTTASVGFLIAPLVIGTLDNRGLDWRVAFLLPAPAWAITYAAKRSLRFPESPAMAPVSGRLPRSYWAYWVSLLLSVSVEWTFVAWGASYLIDRTGIGEGSAALTMTWFFVAMLLGRFSGSRLIRRLPAVTLVLVALGLAMAGFVVWWVGESLAVMTTGLFVSGLGIANLYPAISSLALGAAGAETDLASARIMLTGGLALLIAPQSLAIIADSAGLQAAYSVTVVGLVLLAVATVVGSRLESDRAATIS